MSTVKQKPPGEKPLADVHQFVLTAAQWKSFAAMLKRPVQRHPRLRRLLREPSILERG
jgi:uncharacterized protein (DUF1778 family)